MAGNDKVVSALSLLALSRTTARDGCSESTRRGEGRGDSEERAADGLGREEVIEVGLPPTRRGKRESGMSAFSIVQGDVEERTGGVVIDRLTLAGAVVGTILSKPSIPAGVRSGGVTPFELDRVAGEMVCVRAISTEECVVVE